MDKDEKKKKENVEDKAVGVKKTKIIKKKN